MSEASIKHKFSGDVAKGKVVPMEIIVLFSYQTIIDTLTQNATYPGDIEYAIKVAREAIAEFTAVAKREDKT